MNILFLLPVVSQARYHKRISALTEIGVKPNILAFERDYYKGKVFPDGYICLGEIQHGKYQKRFFPFVKAFCKIRHAAKHAEVIYTFGLDVLLLGWLSKFCLRRNIKIVYEVGDIREILLGEYFYSRLFRLIERVMLKRIDLLVATSEAYVTGYYVGIQGLHNIKYHVIENKLDIDRIPNNVQVHKFNKDNVIRIGYFGIIRCRRSWEILKKAVSLSNGRIRLYVRGIPMGIENFEQEAEATPYVTYNGSYVYPDDLVDMYRQIDVSWIAHYHGKSNLLWSRVNRFYEACFFNKPMLAQYGTEDAKVVSELEIGLCLDLNDVDGAVDRILCITKSDIKQWGKNIFNVAEDIYLYTDEHKVLIEAIK